MTVTVGSIEHLSEVISHVVAPAFLLSAVGSYVLLLSDRTTAIAARINQLGGTVAQAHLPGSAEAEIQRLRGRAQRLNIAVLFALLSGVVAVLLIIGTFAAALRGVQHVWIAAALFIASGVSLLLSLIVYCLDVTHGIFARDVS